MGNLPVQHQSDTFHHLNVGVRSDAPDRLRGGNDACACSLLRGSDLGLAFQLLSLAAMYYHICLVFIEIHWKRALFINTRVRLHL